MARTPAFLRCGLLLLTAAGPVQALPTPPPPLPPLEPAAAATPAPSEQTLERRGSLLELSGRLQRARWLWIGRSDGEPSQLWLPLEVLQGQIGVSSRSLGDGGIELEWFGRRLLVGAGSQRTLGDEVALEVAALFRGSGLRTSLSGDRLALDLPAPMLLGVRPSSAPPGQRRVVLDLSGPTLLNRRERDLLLGLQSTPGLRASLAPLGLQGRQQLQELALSTTSGGEPLRIFTLAEPFRIVIDLPQGAATPAAAVMPPAPTLDPRVGARLGRDLQWDRLVREVNGRRVRLNAVRMDPRRSDLQLRPLSRPEGMEGLSALTSLAGRQDALVAINGGFFNRIRRLPLGALRDRGVWLSGPILNRGAIGWQPGQLPRFGRLRLREWVRDDNGNVVPLLTLNSGYAQRGLSRYTADWGPAYRSISDGESGVLLRQDRVVARIDASTLSTGLALAPGDSLLVGRGGSELPWAQGERLRIESLVSDALGEAPFVLGGGPLLLHAGRTVLDGQSEGFGPAFLSQGAPRTVIGSDGRELWLITLEGSDDEGPTLAETALLLSQLGLRDALNLDGGSSTGLVVGGQQMVRGRGVTAAVHNGLGLVPAGAGTGNGPGAPAGPGGVSQLR
ncbi:MAG: phosphodiester glycosidase family protein [Cyanobium sp.]